MKKFLCIFYAAMLLLTILAACTSDSEGSIVATDGSTSMEKVIGYLSEDFMNKNTDTKVTYNPTGSGAGIQAVQSGRCDIGLSSRDLSDEESENLIGTVVAIDGIAVIVNRENPVSDLSIEQIASLYTGKVTNWKDLGGADAPVVLIGREAASGTRDGFEAITKTEDLCKYTQELTSTGDVVQTVASNPNAIGYASVATVKDSVKLLSVDGILPATETIQNGTYKLCRDFIFVTKKDVPLSGTAKEFFDYATGGAADELIVRAGAVPVAR